MRNMPDGPAPWGIRAAPTGGEGASLAQYLWELIVSFLKPPMQAAAAGSSASPAIEHPGLPRARRIPGNSGSSGRSSDTKPGEKPYISPPSVDKQGEGAKSDYANDKDFSTKEHIARLVEQAKAGSSEAFGEIYRLHHEAIFRFARVRLGTFGKHAAEDAVAETFTRAFKGLPNYKPTGAPFVAWLYGIARHIVVDAGNSERRIEPRGEFEDRAIESPLGAIDHIALSDAIKSLNPKHRKVIELKFILQLTNDEVAAYLGISPGAVNAAQWRALQNLKKVIGKNWNGDES